jgi:rhomboid protease GluP
MAEINLKPAEADGEPALEETGAGEPAEGRAAPPRLTRRFPVLSLALAAALIAMAAAQFAAGGGQLRLDQLGTPYGDWALGAKVPSLIAHGEYWRLVTANYLHASLGHLISNLIPLVMFGWLVETFYGRARAFVLFTLAGVAGTVFSYKVTQSVSLGASTAVMGLVGALLLHNARYRAHLSRRMNNLYPLLVLALVVQFGWDVLNNQTIDVAGHLGGLVGGAVVAALLAGRLAGPRQAERDWLPLPTALATAVLLTLYGAGGLLLTLPGQLPLIRAGQAATPTEAAEAMSAIVAARPYFLEARLEYAALLLRTGDAGAAREAYLDATRQDVRVATMPDARRLRTTIAAAYLDTGERAYRVADYESCLVAMRQAIDLDPDPRVRAHAQNTYAWTLADKLDRDLDLAEREVKEALRVRPEEPAYIDTLAWVYFKRGEYRAALSEQRRAVELMKRAPMGGAGEYFYHLAAIHEKLGQNAEAIENYRQALTMQPMYPEALRGLRRLAPRDPLVVPPPPRLRILPDPAERRGLV